MKPNVSIRILTICFILMGSLGLKAQKQILVFLNDKDKKATQIPLGGMLMLEYNGYLNQKELSMNYMMSLSDSSVVLSKYRLFGTPTEQRKIMLKDITGFRKVSVGSQFLKFALTTAATLGSYYAFSDKNNLNSTERLLYSTGVGLATHFGIKLAFPSKRIKHKITNDWRIISM
ncbi:hypothetical protein [Plebeiibacterium marinum]|uniref:Uncharacterized protein n=1 Tax=Plebeiibacterium marinum TaxID=2992111 RepID=A0AAE3SJZ7_9BACT|nr:hypothetical protein [Plebeiobacterium marinum]MCW3806092.1 hypothetical protein [Plebeiobacterium marinum]